MSILFTNYFLYVKICVDCCTDLNFCMFVQKISEIDLSRACQNDIFLSFCTQNQVFLKSYKNYVLDIFKVLHLLETCTKSYRLSKNVYIMHVT